VISTGNYEEYEHEQITTKQQGSQKATGDDPQGEEGSQASP
jgi:hypothetical protein